MSEGYQGLPAYYAESSDPITPNVGFSLKGMDPIVAYNFVLADTAIGGGGGSSVKVNGSVITNPNFNNTTPAAPAGSAISTWQVSGSNVSSYVNLSDVANLNIGDGKSSIVFGTTAGSITITDGLGESLLLNGTGGVSLRGQIVAVTSSLGAALNLNSGGAFAITSGGSSSLSASSSDALLVTGGVGGIIFTDPKGSVWNNATGGAQGAGTINATGLFVNGVAVGGGSVTSVSNSDGTLTISPTTGAVVASLALGHANTWTGTQTFGTITPTTISGAANFSGTPTFASGAGLGTGTFSGAATFSGNLTFSGTPTFSSGAALGTGTFTGAATFSGNVAFTGTPTFSNPLALGNSTANTQIAGTNNTELATTAFVQSAISASGAVLWNNIGNASAALTLSNGAFGSTFNQTANAVQWTWANTATGTGSTANQSPQLILAANAYNGTTSTQDAWLMYSSLAAGTNGTSTLNFLHSAGSTGVAAISIPAGSPGTAGAWGLTFTGTTVGLAATSTLVAIIGSSNPSLRFYNGATDEGTLAAVGSGTLRGLGMSLASDQANSSVVVAGNVGSSASGIANVVLGGQATHTNTSGTSYGVSIGNGTSSSTGFELFAPSSGTGSYIALNVNPKISQTGTASGSYTAVLVNVVETAVLGTANKLMTLQGGTTGGTTRFEVNSAGVVDTYNSITTAANGMPAEYATVNSTGNVAAITTTTLYAVPAAGTGIYRVSYYLLQTTAATSSASLQLTVGWTDSSSTAQTATSTNLVSNLVGAETSGSFIVQSANSQNITYAVSYTSVGLTAAAYGIYLRLEALG